MKTLVVFAHYDDEVISTPQYLLDHPGSLIFIACGNDPARRDAFHDVVESLDCKALQANFKVFGLNNQTIPALAHTIESIITSRKISRVITHHPLDIHQDHTIVNRAVQIALRRCSNVELFYAKNPEGFPFEQVVWDTMLERTNEANQLVHKYSNIKYPPESKIEYYQTVRRFSL